MLNRASGEWVSAIVQHVHLDGSFVAVDDRHCTAKYWKYQDNWMPEGQTPPRRAKPVYKTVSALSLLRNSDEPQGRQRWRRAKQRLRHIEPPTEVQQAESRELDARFAEKMRSRVERIAERRTEAAEVARALRNIARRERRKHRKREMAVIARNVRKQKRYAQAVRDTRRFLEQLEQAAEPPVNRVMRTSRTNRLFVQLIDGYCAVAANTFSGEQRLLHGPVKCVLEPFERISFGPLPESRIAEVAAHIGLTQPLPVASAPAPAAYSAPVLAAEAKRMLGKLDELLATGFVSESEYRQRRIELLTDMGNEGKAILDAEAKKAREAEEEARAAEEMKRIQEEQARLIAEEEARKARKKRIRREKQRKKRRQRLQRIREERNAVRETEYKRACSMVLAIPRVRASPHHKIATVDSIQDRIADQLASRLPDRW